jgi:hypothetical protein
MLQLMRARKGSGNCAPNSSCIATRLMASTLSSHRKPSIQASRSIPVETPKAASFARCLSRWAEPDVALVEVVTWGLAFVTNYIPNIGSILGVIPPALIALLEEASSAGPRSTACRPG